MEKLDEKIGSDILASYGVEKKAEPAPVPDVTVHRKTQVAPARRRYEVQKFDKAPDKELPPIPDFLQRKLPFGWPDATDQLMKIGQSVQTDGKFAYISEAAFKELTEIMHRTLGDTMEKAGIVWTSDGSAAAREIVELFLENCGYSTGTTTYPIAIGEIKK